MSRTSKNKKKNKKTSASWDPNSLTEEQMLDLALKESLKENERRQSESTFAKDLELEDLTEEERLCLAIELSKIAVSTTTSQKSDVDYNEGKGVTNDDKNENGELNRALELSKMETKQPQVSSPIDDSEFQLVLQLSLDPEEQINREHRQFLQFLQRKRIENNDDDNNIIESSGDCSTDCSDKENVMLLNGLDEEEQLLIAIRRSQQDGKPLSLPSTSSPASSFASAAKAKPKLQIQKANSILSPSSSFSTLSSSSSSSSSLSSSLSSSSSSSRIGNMRPIVIDGCNMAWGHGSDIKFSAKGLLLGYKHFEDQDIIEHLKSLDVLIECPKSRTVSGKHISFYDDLMIIDYASKVKGIVVSRDQYNDIVNHSRVFKEQIRNRLLPFAWVKDTLLLPQDPHGRKGPKLKEFLRYT